MSQSFHSLLNEATSKPGDAGGEWTVISPANLELKLGKCHYRFSEIEAALRGARESRHHLSLLGFDARLAILRSASRTLQNQKSDLFEIAGAELGRGRADLDQEWSRLESLLELFAEDELLEQYKTSEPRGISVVLGSHVWPIYHSAFFAFFNFLAGNPAILKPSEKSSLTVLCLFSLLRAAHPEFAAIQVLLGEKEVGRRLACHEWVNTVIFQGCFEVGMRVRQDNLSQPAKEVLLFLGAKNPSVVFADAPKEACETLVRDAFQGTGQDCQSVSLICIEKPYLKEFCQQLHEKSKSFSIGSPQSGAFMGPLIDGAMLDRYLKFIGISEREGGSILMRGKPLPAAGQGHYVTPTLAVFETLSPEQLRKSVSLQTETLSPHLSIVAFENESHLIALLQQMNHGRNASIWTADSVRAKHWVKLLDYGSIVVNGSTLDSNPKLSFQARRRSGNHAMHGIGLLSQLVFQKQILG